MEPIKVLVVDDHVLFRHGVADVLAKEEGLDVAGEASDGVEAIEKAKEVAPDVVLMDLNMPRCSGLDAIQALQVEMPQAKVLVLTVSEMEADLFAAMKFGATGYLLKNAEPEELVGAILHVARGGVVISPLMAIKLITEFKGLATKAERGAAETADINLSSREVEVLQLVAEGATNKEIGDSLFISESTVRAHLHNIMEKLHLANRAQAAAFAVNKGLVKYRGEEAEK